MITMFSELPPKRKDFKEEECQHKLKLCKRVRSNETIAFMNICIVCGWESTSIKHLSLSEEERNNAHPVDENKLKALRIAYFQEQRRKYFEEIGTSPQWKEWYQRYLLSEEWSKKRRCVLERDRYRCLSCYIADATEVHHKTYRHVGHEPLFDLVSVCDSCHDELTDMERKEKELIIYGQTL